MMGNFLSTITRVKAETILLAGGLPFSGWIIAFSFEQGYLQHFGFSYDFVEVGLTQTLVASLILLGMTYGASIIAIFGEPFYDKNKPLYQKGKEAWALVILFIVVVMVVLFSTSGNEFTFMSIGSLTFLVFCFVYAAEAVRNMLKNAFKRNVVVYEIREGFKIAGRSKAMNSVIFVAAIFVLLSSVNYLGQLAAEHKIEFMVLDEKNDYVLIRRYGDTYLFRQIDRLKRTQLAGVKPFKIGDGKSINLKLEFLGPLTGR